MDVLDCVVGFVGTLAIIEREKMQETAKLVVTFVAPESPLHRSIRQALPEPQFSEDDRAEFFARAITKSTLPGRIANKIRESVEDAALLPILREIWYITVTSN